MSEFHPGLLGLSYRDLFQLDSLKRLDRLFLGRLKAADTELHGKLLAYRQGHMAVPSVDSSEMLIAAAPILETLLGELFQIEDALEVAQAGTLSHRPVLAFKKFFVQRRARRRLAKKEDLESFAELETWLDAALDQTGLDSSDRELTVACYAQDLLTDTETNKDAIEMLTRWCLRAMTTDEGQAAVADWVSFRLPQGVDYDNLVPVTFVSQDEIGRMECAHGISRPRDGFGLTDKRMGAREVQAEIDYCIYCHDHDGDFCSRGFPVKKGDPAQGIKKNPLGVSLDGCPLDEKISEMHRLKRDGVTLGALAMIMVDNPMCPVTGHRICNDCMKACIYQKQNPVNIPEIETRVLTDVLALPWGVEIYDLLTRWNPLRQKQWLPRAYNGKKILINGMGPAGFTLAHHLLMEGFAVVGIDGLKIEKLPDELIHQPIKDYSTLEEDLDTRTMTGFGGVAEYGITVRWDKNFLRLIYVMLMRRQHFQVFGNIRFGGTLTLDEAWGLGFDHVAIAVGAGLPQALPIPGSLARGMRQAADFLMALQLTGAAKETSLANLQVRLPAVVIGGGLTGIDTATEIQAYYIKQVEKTLNRYEILVQAKGEDAVRTGLDEESLSTLQEFLEHGREVRAERERAAKENRAPDFEALIRTWGGVTVVYRRHMKDSPAYQRNHEEVIKAMEEGLYYAECLSPKAASLDQYGHVTSLICQRMKANEDGVLQLSDEGVTLKAGSIFVATGARPNIAYYFEHRGTFELDGANYKTHEVVDDELSEVDVVRHCKAEDFGPFTSYDHDGKRVTFIGDTHPTFNGSVVKAVASAQRTYPKIAASFGARLTEMGDKNEYARFRADMEDKLQPRLESVTRLTPSSVELVVRAPMAVKRFRPGQMFRLQNYEQLAPVYDNTRLQTETVAITGSRVDTEQGTVSLIVFERGASARLASTFKAGDPIAVMGPGGVAATIPSNETVMIVADRLGATAMRSLGPALRDAGNRVIFIVTFFNKDEVFYQHELEAAADHVVWVTSNGDAITPRRDQDFSFAGDLRDAVVAYARGELSNGTPPIPLQEVDDLHIIGSGCCVQRMRDLKDNVLKNQFAKNPKTTGSVYSTMQCMLKGVCSQCLQWQIDPKTGERTKAVFACSWQDQPLHMVDLDHLQERLAQNRLQEHLTNLWLDYVLEKNGIERI
ncbi:MAG: FAD-dependent oxidoreductase [Gammaproteobacteria bacterium]|nr:MAG: FAD-dependent oxidoreductase [Gammaproteobacteria bacterium]